MRMNFLKYFEIVVFVIALCCRRSLADFGSDPLTECPDVDVNFELITGYVFTAPDSILDTRPGVLKLETCIQACKKNSSCRAVNYETGLCVLFTSSAEIEPGNFKSLNKLWPIFSLLVLRTDSIVPNQGPKIWGLTI